MQWEVELRRVDCDGKSEIVRLGKLRRPEASRAKPADFGISLAEARGLLGVLQQAVIQQQVLAYDAAKRECPHCDAIGESRTGALGCLTRHWAWSEYEFRA